MTRFTIHYQTSTGFATFTMTCENVLVALSHFVIHDAQYLSTITSITTPKE